MPDEVTTSSPGLRALARHTVSLANGRPSMPCVGGRGFGVAQAFARDPLRTLLRTSREHGAVTYLQMGPRWRHVPAFLVTHPADVGRVLWSGGKAYQKSFTNLPARSIFGLGLLTSDGKPWAAQRKLVRPLFQRDRLADLESVAGTVCADLVKRWDGFSRDGRVVDLSAEMARASLAVLLDSMFGVPMSEADATDVRQAFSVLSQEAWRRTVSPLWWAVPAVARIPTPRSRQFHRAEALLDTVVRRLVGEQRDGDKVSLLSLLAQARDDDGNSLPWSLVRDEVATFLVAGHETTAAALTWAWHLLDQNPDQYAGFTDPDTTATRRYADAVVCESLRLYPPAWSIVRDTAIDDTLGGYTIPAGSVVITSPYVTHRLESVWRDPESFDPHRFRDGVPEPERGAYFPFGDGMRRCVGERLAMQQASRFMAELATRFVLRAAPGAVRPQPQAAITLRPDRPMLMTVHRRRKE